VLPFLPLTAGQILLNNFLSDIPAVGIAGDRVDPELVAVPLGSRPPPATMMLAIAGVAAAGARAAPPRAGRDLSGDRSARAEIAAGAWSRTAAAHPLRDRIKKSRVWGGYGPCSYPSECRRRSTAP
jgi:hypothetical protein